MNDVAVNRIWRELHELLNRILSLEASVARIDAQIRARLKEEADAAKL